MTAPIGHQAGTTRKASQLIVDVAAAVKREMDAIDVIHFNLTGNDFSGKSAAAFKHVMRELKDSHEKIDKHLTVVAERVKTEGDALVLIEEEQEQLLKGTIKSYNI